MLQGTHFVLPLNEWVHIRTQMEHDPHFSIVFLMDFEHFFLSSQEAWMNQTPHYDANNAQTGSDGDSL